MIICAREESIHSGQQCFTVLKYGHQHKFYSVWVIWNVVLLKTGENKLEWRNTISWKLNNKDEIT